MWLVMLVAVTACEFYYYDPYANPVDRITGRYEVEEYSETYNDFTRYSVWIDRAGSSEVAISNFYGVNVRVYAMVSGDKLTLYRQTVNGYTIEGTGTVYGSQLELNYSVRDALYGYRTDFCEATARRE
jgi:hypothetical protein